MHQVGTLSVRASGGFEFFGVGTVMRRDSASDRPTAEIPRLQVKETVEGDDGPTVGCVLPQRRVTDQDGVGWRQLPAPKPVTRVGPAVGRHATERRVARILIGTELLACLAVAVVALPAAHTGIAVIAAAWWVMQALSMQHDARGRGITSRRRSVFRGYLMIPLVLLVDVIPTSSVVVRDSLLVLGGLVAFSVVVRLMLDLPQLRRRWVDTPTRLVLVGSPVQLERNIPRFAARRDVELVGLAVDPGRSEYPVGRNMGAPIVARLEELAGVAQDLHVDQVRVLAGGLRPLDLEALGWDLEHTHADLVLETSLNSVSSERISSTNIGGSGVVIRSFRANPTTQLVRGVLDRALAGLLLLVLSPLLLVVTMAVRATSPGPAFFRQARVGLAGDHFTMLKFRTMVQDAEAQLEKLADRNRHGDGVLFKIESDPRITKLGRLLRISSIDELPQLFNVVLGHMSLIGPRPALPPEVARYDFRVHRRLAVKPGLTGLWQVSGRSRLSWDETVRLDLDYVDNWTPMRDVRILARTARAVLRRDGAF